MDNKEEIREFILSYVKRYIYEMKFLAKVIEESSEAFDSAKEAIEQFNEVSDKLKAIQDYNFFEEEIERVNPVGLDIGKD